MAAREDILDTVLCSIDDYTQFLPWAEVRENPRRARDDVAGIAT